MKDMRGVLHGEGCMVGEAGSGGKLADEEDEAAASADSVRPCHVTLIRTRSLAILRTDNTEGEEGREGRRLRS